MYQVPQRSGGAVLVPVFDGGSARMGIRMTDLILMCQEVNPVDRSVQNPWRFVNHDWPSLDRWIADCWGECGT